MDPIIAYVIACTHLYGMIHKDKVLEIFNLHNEEKMSRQRVEALIEDPPDALEAHHVHIHQGYFVDEAIYEHEQFDLILQEKGGKPYYVPEKEELLRYVDGMYVQRTREYDALLTYFKKHLFKSGDPEAEWLAEEIQGMCQYGVEPKVIFKTFQEWGIHFKDVDQLNEVLRHITALMNHTRIWENNGHTPHELHTLMEKPHLKPLSDPSVWEAAGQKGKGKIGRNDPCPCGSGRKYKKCCLEKERE